MNTGNLRLLLAALGACVALGAGVWTWRYATAERLPAEMRSASNDQPAFQFVSHDGKVRKKLTMQQAREMRQNEDGDWVDPESGAAGTRVRLAGDVIVPP